MYTDLNKNLTPEDKQIKEEVHRFAAEVLRPSALKLDPLPPDQVIAPSSALWDVFRRAYELGYHSVGLPESHGGLNLSPVARHILAEEMGWGSADFAVALSASPLPFIFAALAKHQEITESVVAPFARDKEAKYIGCWAITEPQHGSDALLLDAAQFLHSETAFSVRAREEGDGWVINGQKSAWVSNGTIATHALMFLGTDPARGASGGGVALVPLDLPGVTRGAPLDKLGQRALNQGEIFLDNVRIPKHYMLVTGRGYSRILGAVLSGANATMGAIFTGVARAAFEEALEYSRQRVQSGMAICGHQAVQLKLADMFIKVEAARALSRAAIAYNSATVPPAVQYSVAAKVFCTRTAFEVASDAVQLHGGYGLAKGMLVEKLFRDARASLIEDGTNEVLSLSAAQAVVERYKTG